MNNVNKTLYIPLYGKAYVSRKSLFLHDPKAEEIWDAEQFPLKGKSKSKYLAYYMGIRSAVFDAWVKQQMENADDAVIIHIGCGMDSRVVRMGLSHLIWYDVDFPEVIAERKRYYKEDFRYQMLSGDARDPAWLSHIPQSKAAIVIMEGVSMYLTSEQVQSVMQAIGNHFDKVALLMDCYTVFAAKASRYKNPINDVGVTNVYGIDDPLTLQTEELRFFYEHDMTPQRYIDQLHGAEKLVLSKLYAGKLSQKLYRLYEYGK
ncbi:MAG: class I SAM-dependent methyltransferase [Clostridia bacterium]|nr:class I SAM-dependent methyltransferase [Clostridia bacterium]